MRKILFLLLSSGLSLAARAQTAPARPTPGVGSQLKGTSYSIRRTDPAAATSMVSKGHTYQTQPHALRVLVPDTAGQKMRHLPVTPAPNTKVAPLPPQQKIPEPQ